jgi:hypothetical protein
MATSTYPAEFFANPHQVRTGYCFVLMPFREDLREVYDNIIRTTVEGAPLNFECRRADDFFRGGHILTDILRGIAEAEIVIADLTDKNPNVFYELGIAHMSKDPSKVILLTQDMEFVPFDLRGFRCIVYTQSISGAQKLRSDLLKALAETAPPVYRFDVAIGQPYELEHRLMGDERCLYDFILEADWLGANALKFRLTLKQYVAGEAPRLLHPEGYGLSQGEELPIPRIPWKLRVNAVREDGASFSLVHV